MSSEDKDAPLVLSGGMKEGPAYAAEQSEVPPNSNPENIEDFYYQQLLRSEGVRHEDVEQTLDDLVTECHITARMYRVLKACVEVASGT